MFIPGYLVICLILTHSCYGQLDYSCAEPSRTLNPQTCIQFIKQETENPSRFWYGTPWDGFCSDKHERFSECVSGKPFNQRQFLTLGSRIFLDNTYSSTRYLGQLQYVPKVQYRARAGSFSGCNTTENVPFDVTFDVYPGMSDVTPYFVKDVPSLDFPGCTQSQLCTVMFYDSGHAVLHNAWSNYPIQQNFSNYIGPGINVRTTNPYVWMYFYQQGVINNMVAPESQPLVLNLTQFMSQYSLTGPIGINWLSVVSDAQSLGRLATGRLRMQNCPTLLIRYLTLGIGGSALQDLQLNSVPEFDMWLSVAFGDPSRSSELWIDSIRNSAIPQSVIVNQPTVYLAPRIALFEPSTDFVGQQYSLILIETPTSVGQTSTSSLSQNPFNSQSYSVTDRNNMVGNIIYNSFQGGGNANGGWTIRWLVINSADSTMLRGETLIPYNGRVDTASFERPNPRQFYLLLYRQTSMVNSQTLQQWLTGRGCSNQANYRCSFNLQDLASILNARQISGFARFTTN